MAHTYAIESQRLAEDTYDLIQLLDPATWQAELEASARELLHKIRARLERLQSQFNDFRDERLLEAVGSVAGAVEDFSEQGNWRTFFKRLQPAYEAMAARLSQYRMELPRLRPTNYHRNVLHVGMGLFALTSILLLPRLGIQIIISGIALFAITAESLRRVSPAVNAAMMRMFHKVAHPHEHFRVNSASWYTMALAILAFSASTMACAVAVIVLGLADPAAALIGKRFGRIKLRGGRSLEGSAAFFVVGLLAAAAVIALFFPGYGGAEILAFAAAASLLGALAEVLSGPWLDDNFSVPLASALGIILVALIL